MIWADLIQAGAFVEVSSLSSHLNRRPEHHLESPMPSHITRSTRTYSLELYEPQRGELVLSVSFVRPLNPLLAARTVDLDVSPEQLEELPTLRDAIDYVATADDFDIIDLLDRYGYTHLLGSRE